MTKHFVSMKDFSREQIFEFFDRIAYFESEYGTSKNYSKFIISMFFEPSTRTDLSFQLAGKKLGLNFLNFDSIKSSLSKGESVLDTFLNLDAMGFDGYIVRTKENGFFKDILPHLRSPIINAGEGTMEHPSQALLDAYSIWKEFRRIENLNIAIVGDITHSRVAHSNLDLLAKFNNNITLFSSFLLDQAKYPGMTIAQDYDDFIRGADVVMLLRNQVERHAEYHNEKIDPVLFYQKFGLNEKRVQLLKKDAIIMHPGPIIHDQEIAPSIIQHPQSRIYKQVQHSIPTRQAIFDYCLSK